MKEWLSKLTPRQLVGMLSVLAAVIAVLSGKPGDLVLAILRIAASFLGADVLPPSSP